MELCAFEREVFKRPIAKFQGIQWMLADAATQVEAARMLRNNETFYGFEKLWTGTKIFWGARGGLELDLRLSHCLSLCLETNVIMFPDEFNSKVGKDDPFDWQFNCLVGFKFSFGR